MQNRTRVCHLNATAREEASARVLLRRLAARSRSDITNSFNTLAVPDAPRISGLP